jgi:hypothetical protein
LIILLLLVEHLVDFLQVQAVVQVVLKLQLILLFQVAHQ